MDPRIVEGRVSRLAEVRARIEPRVRNIGDRLVAIEHREAESSILAVGNDALEGGLVGPAWRVDERDVAEGIRRERVEPARVATVSGIAALVVGIGRVLTVAPDDADDGGARAAVLEESADRVRQVFVGRESAAEPALILAVARHQLRA